MRSLMKIYSEKISINNSAMVQNGPTNLLMETRIFSCRGKAPEAVHSN